MAKLNFTGSAEAPVAYLGKYQVETGTVLEDVNEADVNALLQTGVFQVVEDDGKDSSKSKSSDTKDTKGKS